MLKYVIEVLNIITIVIIIIIIIIVIIITKKVWLRQKGCRGAAPWSQNVEKTEGKMVRPDE